jgi:hypothetical protein
MTHTFDLEKPTPDLLAEIMEYAEKNKEELDVEIILDDKSKKMKHMVKLSRITLSDDRRLAETITEILTDVYRKSADYSAKEKIKRGIVIDLMNVFKKKVATCLA